MAPSSPVANPKVLIVPGLEGSGVDHWQSAWERERGDCRRVELGDWSDPQRDAWSTRLDRAIEAEAGGVYLVAHSLGCLAVCWWAARARSADIEKVAGALLVAPPDVDRDKVDARLARFAPTPDAPLPFPAMLVASSNDPYASIDRSRAMAAMWDAQLVDLGALGHINARSGLGAWPGGQLLLALLIRQGASRVDRGGRGAEIPGLAGLTAPPPASLARPPLPAAPSPA